MLLKTGGVRTFSERATIVHGESQHQAAREKVYPQVRSEDDVKCNRLVHVV